MNLTSEVNVTSDSEPKRFLSAADIKDTEDVLMEDHYVPLWNGWVTIRGLSGTSRDAWEESMTKRVGKGKNERVIRVYSNARAKLLIRCIWDRAANKPLFEETPDNINLLGAKSGKVLSEAFDIACRLSGIGEDTLEEIEGNSDDADGDGSLGG